MRTVTVALVTFLFSQTGCYFYYPRHLPRRGTSFAPDLVDGAEVEIRSEVRNTWRECTDHEVSNGLCYVKNDKWRRDFQTRWYWAEYNGKPLKRRELFSLVDPDFSNKLQKIRDLRGVCRISLIPTALAVASLTVSLIGSTSRDLFSHDQKLYLAFGGLIGAGVFMAAAYPLGGNKCLEAHRLAGAAVSDEISGDADQQRGEWKVVPEELAPLIADFNNRVRNGTTGVVEARADTPAGPGNNTTPSPTNESPAGSGGGTPRTGNACVDKYVRNGWGTKPDAELNCGKFTPEQFARAERIARAGAKDAMTALLAIIEQLEGKYESQMDRAEGLIRAGVSDTFTAMIESTFKFTTHQIDCAEKAFLAAKAKNETAPRFSPEKCPRK